ncbi:hypothetical protein NLJ89_g6726 [Agrocybe chaxingu]|uniref:PBP domain-containing protein n=1 Tax=Agrocybe chaxingu TaxID=84603 RepID=A0A9W8MVR0_9AGAR|nr:hypothetical protein NLJ89_g6726 [Agrocybe chaxingu]
MFLLKLLSRLFLAKELCSALLSEKSGLQYTTVDSDLVVDVKNLSEILRHEFVPKSELLPPSSFHAQNVKPRAIYDGGFPESKQRGVCLRIANGGAGQTGLLRAWADAFIQDMVKKGSQPFEASTFEVAWYLGDTTESLSMLAAGIVDVALTYNAAAEKQAIDTGSALQRVYALRDHFMLVGPLANPAKLHDEDDILTMFNKIVTAGNADVLTPPDPNERPATRFLSRYDKSATNIKESQIFATIGQVPWAYDYSKWYHQYPRFPQEALQAASFLSEYTLIDQGTWLSAPNSIRAQLRIFKLGSDDAADLLLNPGHVLYGTKAVDHEGICRAFMDWVVSPIGGQKILESFSKNGHVMYSKAP